MKISMILKGVIAIIFLQTLFYKFTGHPDSVYIFSQLHAEPYGRWMLGVVELIVAIGLFVPRFSLMSVVTSFLVINGAIFSHLLVLGWNVGNDHGKLFLLAVIVWVFSLILIVLNKKEIKRMIAQWKISLNKHNV